MKTHTELLTEIIEAVYALPISPKITEVHDLQMKAAEIKGQMMATETTSPKPDADGWVANTGVDPECMIIGLKLQADKDYSNFKSPISSNVFYWSLKSGITHYKPA